jgi:pimeloyl-ACP methyl ester carboxylesterase
MSEIQRTLKTARRLEQLHAWGKVVWHVWGEGKNHAPLVLLHGGSGSWTHWLRSVEHLSQRHEVWALDTPGFGDSDLPPQARDADDLVPFVAEILQHTFDGQAVRVMGFSFGGMLAGMVSAEFAHLFRHLVLLGVPGLGLMGAELPMRGMFAGMSESQRRAVHRHNLNTMMLHQDSNITDEVIDLQQANVVRDRLRRRKIARTDVLVGAQAQWTCPVDGIWGEHDALYRGTLQRIPEVLWALRSFHVVPDAGHWVMFENAPVFHRIVDRLLLET